MLEHNRSLAEMNNAIEVMEERMAVLEQENITLKEENTALKEEHRKIALFVKGLDREIENVCAYLSKEQDD